MESCLSDVHMIPRGGKRHFGFWQRWGILLAWLSVLVAALFAQILAEPPQGWPPLWANRNQPMTPEEFQWRLWNEFVPQGAMALTSVVVLLGARWLVPDPHMRWPVRAFGLAAFIVAYSVSRFVVFMKTFWVSMD